MPTALQLRWVRAVCCCPPGSAWGCASRSHKLPQQSGPQVAMGTAQTRCRGEGQESGWLSLLSCTGWTQLCVCLSAWLWEHERCSAGRRGSPVGKGNDTEKEFWKIIPHTDLWDWKPGSTNSHCLARIVIVQEISVKPLKTPLNNWDVALTSSMHIHSLNSLSKVPASDNNPHTFLSAVSNSVHGWRIGSFQVGQERGRCFSLFVFKYGSSKSYFLFFKSEFRYREENIRIKKIKILLQGTIYSSRQRVELALSQ